ncbi:BaiN/RdsA family NAD(P)/FAD-dependent oxidoreductase [Basilea psittacipulmonis]|uniref:Membrane protein n=1 Tax=Basilea psittacipulmonis DSM 24701 TaxID=1072685 RepID=A0A077DCQ4_9BURK|nr:NAD(P)/FAD-dependent oxidoreductase [Basilea psittacipulmonis]AIL32384.1 membrane protein [Basilea psittacipulmonis DSM 24701]
MSNQKFDVLIIGAGAAGMMCASRCQNKKVLLVDHASVVGEKIRISGGGRCNFTNLHASYERYVSKNPHFARSALALFQAKDMVNLLDQYGIGWHEKHLGQLFCDESAVHLVEMLKQECQRNHVKWSLSTTVHDVLPLPKGFRVKTSQGDVDADNVVIATGGMAAPAVGATDWGIKIAKQFGLKIVETKPALVPLIFHADDWQGFSSLSGISLPVTITTGQQSFEEDLLFTHKGLSGPAILQISSYWNGRDSLIINLLPDTDLEAVLLSAQSSKLLLGNVLSGLLPKRLVQQFLTHFHYQDDQKIATLSKQSLKAMARVFQSWEITPKGTAGYKKAEAMSGGVSTDELSQKTMESKKVPGLYFIGEVVDITGWLGGYNFQWAWSSAVACATHLSTK